MSLNQKNSNIDNALLAWGEGIPEWVKTLAIACDKTSQRSVGARLGYCSATISKVINRKYPGGYGEIGQLVRVIYGQEDVDCPLFGAIPLASCIRNRRRKAPPANHLHIQFAQSCPDCPNNTDRGAP